ncbi:Uncharacterised protein [Streptococcus sanguinis]|uniref:Uncharacterized protein n=1 Tax=Streptococcus sanguinis TaxID=1305 RepID=A0A2X4AJ93_STRSA|nr:Uncharacterised protein [Streptococcus sanguinis]
MIQEIDMTPDQAIVFVSLLLFLIWKLWHLNSSQSSLERFRVTESSQTEESTTDKLTPEYGAYIQLAGRKYN